MLIILNLPRWPLFGTIKVLMGVINFHSYSFTSHQNWNACRVRPKDQKHVCTVGKDISVVVVSNQILNTLNLKTYWKINNTFIKFVRCNKISGVCYLDSTPGEVSISKWFAKFYKDLYLNKDGLILILLNLFIFIICCLIWKKLKSLDEKI